MSQQDKSVSSSVKKADAFMQHYAKESRLQFSKSERDTNRTSRRLKSAMSADDAIAQDFTMLELEKAIASVRSRGAAGPDKIKPAFIKSFGHNAKCALLALYNDSWNHAAVPQGWRNATIVPLLKAGKDPASIASYRPISLTSCLAKVLERMIASRLVYLIETRGLLSNNQCGGPKIRCCEDFIIRLTKAIDDAFQSRKPGKVVMALLHYSKAFDRVWRQKLILTLVDKTIPSKYICWIAAFLKNRQARCLYGATLSRTKKLQQGVPQGSVLAPLLFLLFIDPVTNGLQEDYALFMDDLSVWSANQDKGIANERIQNAVNHVVEWSKENKLTLNTQKCEAAYFSARSTDANWKPPLHIDNVAMPFNPTPKILGVRMDKTLSFGAQVEDVTQKVKKRTSLLRAAASRDWGWHKKTLRRVFHSTQCSVMDYAAPGWQPFLSSTNTNKLEKAQNQALRAIIGQYSSTPLEALRLESGFQSYATHSKRLTASSQQKAFRLPTEHPRAVALSSTLPRRLKRSSWKPTAQELLSALPDELEKQNCPQPGEEKPPWEGFNASNWTVADIIAGARTKCPKETTLDVLRNLKGDIYLYTDGSASHSNENWGYAVVVAEGDQATPDVIAKLRKRCRVITSSFDEEKAAMLTAVSWLTCNQQRGTTDVICADSQSLCTALWKRNNTTAGIRSHLDSHHSKVINQWIPGHSDVAGNELADSESRKAAVTTISEAEPTSPRAALSCIRRTFKDPEPCHHLAKPPTKTKTSRQKLKKSRAKRTLSY